MKELVLEPIELSPDERNLLLIAYKNNLSPKQNAFRNIQTFVSPSEEITPEDQEIIQEQRKIIESEIEALCNEVLGMVDEKILPNTSTAEGRVFFNKMKADYLR